MHQNKHKNSHVPVLLDAALTYLEPKAGESYLDLTAGYGGHAEAVLAQTRSPEQAVLIDRDQAAIGTLKRRFKDQPVKIIHSDFLSASQTLQLQEQRFDLILADLGMSSPHLDTASRGFAIRLSGPLDMRMDTGQVLTADTVVNTYGEHELAEIFRRFGEESKAKKIARLIIENRPVTTTTELATIVARAWPAKPGRTSRLHPATKVFQALRIVVNDELRQLETALPIWIDLLKRGGRLVVISFHSLEDRIVKQVFANNGGDRYDACLKILTKRPVTGSKHEVVSNPRARSAKLRAAVKINN